MALRAFQSNPAIGGFGGEGGSQLDYITRNNDRPTKKATQTKEQSKSVSPNNATHQHHSSSTSSQLGSESCDAFAQIVKELVDNAVDACARENDNDIGKEQKQQQDDASPPVSSKRVRVEIKPTQISIDNNGDENDADGDTTATMECLRVKVSDNGCGMEDIDDCVSAFRSTKNGSGGTDANDGKSSKQKTSDKQNKSKSKKKKNSGSTTNNKHASSSSSLVCACVSLNFVPLSQK